MERKMPRSRIVRIALYAVLLFTLFSVVIWIFLNSYFNKKIIAALKEQVSVASHGKYVLSLDKLSINPWTRSITISDLIVAPSKQELLSKAQYVFRAQELRVLSVDLLSYFNDKDLVIRAVEFDEPQISIFQGSDRFPRKKADSLLADFSLYELISEKLNSVSIGQIDIMNSHLNVFKNGTDTLSVFSSNDNSLAIKDFEVNSRTDKAEKLFSAKKFEIVLNNFSCQLGDGMYTLFGRRLHTSYTDSILTLDSLLLIPNFDKKEFAEEAGKQVSRINLMASKVVCDKMDVKLLFEYNWVVVKKLDLAGCVINVHRDNRQPLAPIVRASPQAMIKALPFFVSIDSVEMKDGTVIYQERNFDQVASERVVVNKMNGVITGVQNDSTIYTESSSIRAELSASFMGLGVFTGVFTFPLLSTEEHFSCDGTLSSMPMPALNVMIPRAKKLKFVSGQLDKASFSFVARDTFSSGTMKFLYHDLKVELMSKKEESPRLKEKIKTFLANELVIIDSNPNKEGRTRISPIYVEHNPYRYFIFYAMQSIVSGMTAAIQDEQNAKRLAGKK